MQNTQQVQSTSHFFDQNTATLYLDNGKVFKAKNPSAYSAASDVTSLVNKLEGALKKRGVINQEDSVLFVC